MATHDDDTTGDATYDPPTVEHLGTLAELTEGAIGGPGSDGVFGMSSSGSF